ncbi:MAG: translocation/assembly module TamB domain-containing protein [Flavobacteriales bacterium]
MRKRFWTIGVATILVVLSGAALLTPVGQNQLLRPAMNHLLSNEKVGLTVQVGRIAVPWWRGELTIDDVDIHFAGEPIHIDRLAWIGFNGDLHNAKFGVVELTGVQGQINWAFSPTADSSSFDFGRWPTFAISNLNLCDIQLEAAPWTVHWDTLELQGLRNVSKHGDFKAQFDFSGLNIQAPDSLWTGPWHVQKLRGIAMGIHQQLDLDSLQILSHGFSWDGNVQTDLASGEIGAEGQLHCAPSPLLSHLKAVKAGAQDSLWGALQPSPWLQSEWTGQWAIAWSGNLGTGHLSWTQGTGPMESRIENLLFGFPEPRFEAHVVTSPEDWQWWTGDLGFKNWWSEVHLELAADSEIIQLGLHGDDPNAPNIELTIEGDSLFDHGGIGQRLEMNFDHLDTRAFTLNDGASPEFHNLKGTVMGFSDGDDWRWETSGTAMSKNQQEQAWEATGNLQFSDNIEFSGDLEWISAEFPVTASGTFLWGSENDWRAQLNTQLRGVKAPAGATSLYGQLSFDVTRKTQEWSGTDARIEAKLEGRNLTFLGGKRPIQLQRLDAFGHWNSRHFALNWASDLGHGQAKGDGRLERWLDWIAAEEHRLDSRAVPQADVDISIADWRPVSALFGWPLSVSPGTRFSWHSDGKSHQFHSQFRSDRMAWDTYACHHLGMTIDGSLQEFFLNVQMDSLSDPERTYAQSIFLDVHADTVWNADANWLGFAEEIHAIRLEVEEPDFGTFEARLHEMTIPVAGLPISMIATDSPLRWRPSDKFFELPLLTFETQDGTITLDAPSTDVEDFHLALSWDEPKFPLLKGLPSDSEWTEGIGALKLKAELCGDIFSPELNANLTLENWAAPFGQIDRLEMAWNGDVDGGAFLMDVQQAHHTLIGAHGTHGPGEQLDAFISLKNFPSDWANPLLTSSTVNLSGPLTGVVRAQGNWNSPALSGAVRAEGIETEIGYLGTTFEVNGVIELQPEYIALDNWKLTDQQGHSARATGTLLHDKFSDWNFDISLDMSEEDILLMDLERDDNDLFFGQAYVTGFGNVSGSQNDLLIESELATASGTRFALPMDRIESPTYADFIQLTSSENNKIIDLQLDEDIDLNQIRMKIGIEVNDDAEARIIFNELIGDEIVGKTKGHLDLAINDFERFEMNGELEVVEGHYNLALSGILQKRFVVDPGGTITWVTDPYGADMNLIARHTVRTRLDNLLPGTANLPGRVPVDLRLALNGALLRPDIAFDVELPRASPQLQAMVDNALFDEDEKNRQAVGLLALGQFLSQDPNTPLIADVNLTEQSTALLTAQLGNWLSSLAQGVDVGLNYGSNALNGEQEVALALSTQFFDDRLHIEGEARGTTTGETASQADVQLQDVRIAYDLTEDGRIQISGYRESAPSWNGIDGMNTMGIGLRFIQQFNRWSDLWNRKKE